MRPLTSPLCGRLASNLSIPNSKSEFSKSKKPFSESKKPCYPPFQIKTDLRRLNMKNSFFKKKSRKRLYTNVLARF